MIKRLLAATAGAAALATAAPAAAQYPHANNPYAANPYAYGNQYARSNRTHVATQQCTAAVQSRLNNPRTLSGVVGAMIGVPTARGQVLSVTQVNPRRDGVRVRGLATSGTSHGYGPYGVGAYGSVAYAHQPDLSFTCQVDRFGRVRDVDINRRR